MCTPPEFDVTLTRALDRTLIQESVTEQGVSMNISERLWIGTSLSDETDPRTRGTWNDIVWEGSRAEIGLFTVKKSVADAYLAGGNPADVKCFPFLGEKGGVWLTVMDQYRVPSGNNSADNPYNYHNANLLVKADTSRHSKRFFTNSGSEPLNFYGYFPYQHQTQGINYTLPSTSICKVLRADRHEDNLLAMPYTFSASQTAGNIQRHDVMYSVSEEEEEGGRNRYGNIGKNGQGTVENDNNVHMRFVHSFCRLQFNISAGSYRADKSEPIKLSRLYLAGSKVFVDGTLNLIKGEVTPGNASIIVRDLDLPAGKTYFDLREGNLTISMIVQPTGVIESLDDFRIVCVVDGVEYSCPLKPGVELVTNHVYDVNLVLDPDTKVLLTNGGGAKVVLHDDVDGGGNIINSHQGFEENIVVTWAKSIVIQPEPGWRLLRIIKNGVVQDENLPAGPHTLNIGERPERETTKYEVVCIPNDWYARPEAMTMHLDGLMNYGYVEDQKLIPIWKDLTFNGNDGILYNFDLTQYADKTDDTGGMTGGIIDIDKSGWDTKGLKFDGKDDVVAFPGKINWKALGSEYTVSMYLCVSTSLQTIYHRIISSGDNTQTGFPALVLNSNGTNVRLFGHNEDNNFGSTNDNLYSGKNRGRDIIQLDYVYKQTAATTEGTVTLYVNGVYRGVRVLPNGHGTAANPRYKSVPWTSIGGRLTDISRQIQAAYYNVMIYDVALTPTEIKQNYDLNVDRFGTTKTDTGTWAPVP